MLINILLSSFIKLAEIQYNVIHYYSARKRKYLTFRDCAWLTDRAEKKTNIKGNRCSYWIFANTIDAQIQFFFFHNKEKRYKGEKGDIAIIRKQIINVYIEEVQFALSRSVRTYMCISFEDNFYYGIGFFEKHRILQVKTSFVWNCFLYKYMLSWKNTVFSLQG